MTTEELIKYIYETPLEKLEFKDPGQKCERALILLLKYGHKKEPELEKKFKNKANFGNITPQKAIEIFNRVKLYNNNANKTSIVNDPVQRDYDNFKKMLKYFVHILRANDHENPEQFIDNEPKSGQGYKGYQIRNSYKNFRNFSNDKTMDVSVTSYNFPSKTCYINWTGTACNVRAIWKSHDVIALQLYVNNDDKWVGDKVPLVNLGLNENDTPNEQLKAFYKQYLSLLQNTSYKDPMIYDLVRKLISSKNIILRGAPGTGKTYLARKIAASLIGIPEEKLDNCKQYGFVQFHPSYDYTDFVEGLRPVIKGSNKQMSFELTDGIFKKFCRRAIESKSGANQTSDEIKWDSNNKKFVFIIDEINRGEIAKIFGELFFALDPGYRGNKKFGVYTQYSNLHQDPHEKFFVPDNVYIIGTMNDIDRSVDSFDFAMRRRFRFIEIQANTRVSMLDSLGGKKEDAINRMNALNNEISKVEGLNKNYYIGPSYFLKLNALNPDQLWTDYLAPLLREYIRGLHDEKNIMAKFKKAYNHEYTEDKQ